MKAVNSAVNSNSRFDLGLSLQQQGKFADAIAQFKTAMKQDNKNADLPYLIGICYLQLNDNKRAVNFISKAIKLNNARAEMHNNLGIAYRNLKDFHSAVSCFEKGIALDSEFSACRYNLALSYKDLGLYDRAVELLKSEIQTQPRNAQLYFTLGNIYKDGENYQMAIESFRKATEIKPDYKEAWVNLGNNCKLECQYEEASAAYDRALTLDPNNHAVSVNKGMLLLQDEQYKAGWPLYEKRIEIVDFQDNALKKISSARWTGESIKGKTILIYAEQGLGDTVQFVRYASWVKTLGATVLFYVDKALKGLLSDLQGVDQVIARGETIPKHDFRVSVMSLPSVYYALSAKMKFDVPYLFAKEAFLEKWNDRLQSNGKLKVGIVWQGNPDYIWDKYRSVPLEFFLPLMQNDNLQIYALQVGDPKNQLKKLFKVYPDLAASVIDIGMLIQKEGASFDDTAAIVKTMDVVVAADTSMAHIAGSLGVATKTALNVVPDWRWTHKETQARYYPNMQLYRQTIRNDWQSVFDKINDDLNEMFKSLKG